MNIPWDKIFELALLAFEKCFPTPTGASDAAERLAALDNCCNGRCEWVVRDAGVRGPQNVRDAVDEVVIRWPT
jgi:hypothetical protein